ncbi:MAG: hypothetical protein PUD93_11395 [Lachnospiraceae bacterium]|nr:hypothetical protein [Lachnospiraceae bacterium]
MANKETWGKWENSIHESEDSKKRIFSAQSASLTPVRIDTTDGMAYFQGRHGKYETFLDYCPCGDFHRRHLPCKHIYRLAMELDLIDKSDMKSDTSSIPFTKFERNSVIESLISILEDGGLSIMKRYAQLASSALNSDSKLFLTNPLRYEDNYLISNKLFCVSEKPDTQLFEKLKKNDILTILDQHKIDYPPKIKCNDLKELLLSDYLDKLKELFPDRCMCFLNPEYKTIHKDIYSYCLRVDDPYRYLSNCNITGSYKFITGKTECHYVIPDTEINRLYFKYGHTFDEDITNNPYLNNDFICKL